MLTSLTKSQLAFITKSKVSDARKKMIIAWCKEKGLEVPELNQNEEEKPQMKAIDKYPDHMEIDMLSRHLNLPDLQMAVDDIRDNYLTRSSNSAVDNRIPTTRDQRERADTRKDIDTRNFEKFIV